MMIPPGDLAHTMKKPSHMRGIYLKSSHLCFDVEIRRFIGSEQQNVFLAYYKDKGYLLMSPVSNAFFPKLHPSTQHIIKAKSLSGAHSIALHELLIDHQIAEQDRQLDFELIEKTKVIKVYLK